VNASILSVSLNTAFDRLLEVPGLEIGGHVRARLLAIQPAGKSVNVARILGLLGTPAVLTGFVGRGDRPSFERSFRGRPVRIDLIETASPTRQNVTMIDPRGNVETHVREAGFPVLAADLARLSKRLAKLCRRGACVHFGGSLPPGMKAAAFGKLLAVCGRRGTRVSVDTSGEGLVAVRKAKGLWLLKPNRLELAELSGRAVEREADLLAAAASLLGRTENVLVSVGAEGAYLVTAAGAWHAKADVAPGRIVKTVGCGDALVAGFLKASTEGRAPPACLRLAVATGTAAAFQACAGVAAAKDVRAVARHVTMRPF